MSALAPGMTSWNEFFGAICALVVIVPVVVWIEVKRKR